MGEKSAVIYVDFLQIFTCMSDVERQLYLSSHKLSKNNSIRDVLNTEFLLSIRPNMKSRFTESNLKLFLIFSIVAVGRNNR